MASDHQNPTHDAEPDLSGEHSRAFVGANSTLSQAERERRMGLRRRSWALVELFEDDSPRILGEVYGELKRLGRIAGPALRQGVKQASPRLRSRARHFLLAQERAKAFRRLLAYAMRRQHELEPALCLLDAFAWPQVDWHPYKRALDAMGGEVLKRMARRRPGLHRGLVLPEYIGGELGFAGPDADYHHPDNISLSHSIERKRGLPLTLCAIYSAVGRRAGIQTQLLPFPGHVLLRIEYDDQRAIIDPFGGGRVLTERKCLSYLADHGLPYRAEWFKPASDSIIFARHLRNLMNSYRARKRFDLVRALGRVLGCLEKGRPGVRTGLRRIR